VLPTEAESTWFSWRPRRESNPRPTD